MELSQSEKDKHRQLIESQPKKRFHKNEQVQGIGVQEEIKTKKPEFILDQKLTLEMVLNRKVFQQTVNGRKIYFPYQKLNSPQEKFIHSMLDCLDAGTNLLIQSPTGTGKTLSLLVSALSWAEEHYKTTQGEIWWQDQIKIVYTSRAHSQLNQISKQLQKTSYRPKMMIFGSRQKMCINEKITDRINSKQKTYGDWHHRCNVAVRLQEQFLKGRDIVERQKMATLQLIEQLEPILYKTKQQQEQLKDAKDYLEMLDSRCEHYQPYDKGYDAMMNNKIGRQVLNNDKLKKFALQNNVCPYFYPKRVKNRATLYLMPYNYILDAKIMEYSKGFLEKSIIIFDEGHNVPSTACDGFSINFTSNVLEAAKKSLTQRLSDKDYNADQNEMEHEIRREKVPKFQPGDDDEEEMLLIEMRRRNDQKEIIKQENGPENLKAHTDYLLSVINLTLNSYQKYFETERTQDLKQVTPQFLNSQEGQFERRMYNWQAVRDMNTAERPKIIALIEEILYSRRSQLDQDLSLRMRIDAVIRSLDYVIEYFMKKYKKYFKLVTMRRFYAMLKGVLYDKDWSDKFFLEVIQSKKYDTNDKKHLFRGEINIKCLAPEFSFRKLQELNPRSIIITSGTLSPMNIFANELGLRFQKVQIGHVITEQNVIVRKVTKTMEGYSLKIDSVFFSGRDGLEFGNLHGLFNLLIHILKCIPHGVLIIVSSFVSLKQIEMFFNHERSREIIKRLKEVKPHVYFESKESKSFDTIMQRFRQNSQTGKGALLFCVCRAKLSEGIDFKDRLCRSVIFFGIPYVNKGDNFIVEKGRYLNMMKYSYASEWKFIEASKAINQGLGRTVRHAKDYGSILLFDIRYHETNRDSAPVVANISEWIRKSWKASNSVEELQNELKQFYSRCEDNFPLQQNSALNEEGQKSLTQYFKNKYQT